MNFVTVNTTCATKVFKAKLPKNAPLEQGILISVCWSLKCCWTRSSWRVKSCTWTLGSEDIYVLQLYVPEEEGHRVLPHMRGLQGQTDIGGGMSRWWTGGTKGTAHLHGASPDCTRRVPQSAPCRGRRQRWGNVINRRHQVLAWESKAELWTCHSVDGVSLRCQEVLQRHWKTQLVTGN